MPEKKSYRSLSGPSRAEYKEKGSKFLAFAYPIASEEEVLHRLAELRKEYFDARHHCYAYILGVDGETFRANDDGEPGHSAGDPILGQIRTRELTHTLVVVVRYFGGVKLGVGGLIHAYRTAASEALDRAVTKVVGVTKEFTITYGYDVTSEVMRLIDEMDAAIIEQQFKENCRVTFAVNVALAPKVHERIELLKNLGHQVEWD